MKKDSTEKVGFTAAIEKETQTTDKTDKQEDEALMEQFREFQQFKAMMGK